MSTRELLAHSLLWGLGLGTAVSLGIQILTWMDLGLTYWTWVSTYGLVVIFALLATRSLGRRLGMVPRFAQTLVSMAIMILISRLIYQTYMFVYITFVDPTWVDTVAEVWGAQMRDSGLPEEKATRYIADFRRQWETGYIFSFGIFRYGVDQLILGLLTAILGVIQPWRKGPRQSLRAAS